MTYKDPITGCEVADWNEVMGIEDWKRVWKGLEEDSERLREELRENWQDTITRFVFQEWENWIGDPVGYLPAHLIRVGASVGFGGAKGHIDYVAVNGKAYRWYRADYAGSFYEPPDMDVDIMELERVKK